MEARPSLTECVRAAAALRPASHATHNDPNLVVLVAIGLIFDFSVPDDDPGSFLSCFDQVQCEMGIYN